MMYNITKRRCLYVFATIVILLCFINVHGQEEEESITVTDQGQQHEEIVEQPQEPVVEKIPEPDISTEEEEKDTEITTDDKTVEEETQEEAAAEEAEEENVEEAESGEEETAGEEEEQEELVEGEGEVAEEEIVIEADEESEDTNGDEEELVEGEGELDVEVEEETATEEREILEEDIEEAEEEEEEIVEGVIEKEEEKIEEEKPKPKKATKPFIKESTITHLTDETFEHATQAYTGQTTGSWLIWFHDGTDDTKIDGTFPNESLEWLQDDTIRVVIGAVNINNAKLTQDRWQMYEIPTFLYISRGKAYELPKPYGTWEDIHVFCKNPNPEYAIDIPPPPTFMQHLLVKLGTDAENSTFLFAGIVMIIVFGLFAGAIAGHFFAKPKFGEKPKTD